MKTHYFTYFLLFFTTITWSQVGIGTTTPNEMLEVNGTVRVGSSDDINEATGILAADADGTLTTINLQNNLKLENGELNYRRGTTYEIGEVDLTSVVEVAGEFPDLELFLGPGEVNEGKTVIYLKNTPASVRITGFQDGVDGMHIFLYHTSPRTLQFIDWTAAANNSTLTNSISVLSNNETMGGQGCVEFIYDGDSQRWLFLSIHE